MPPVEESPRVRRWPFLFLCLGLVLAGAAVFLNSMGAIRIPLDTGPRAPRWLGVFVSALLLLGGLAPVLELVSRGRGLRSAGRARAGWSVALGLLFLLALAVPANWIVWRYLRAADALFAGGPLPGVLRALGLLALLLVTACLDAYIGLLGLWLLKSPFRRGEPGAELLGRRP